MPDHAAHSHTKLFIWLALLIVALALLAGFGYVQLTKPPLSEQIRTGVAPRPLFTPEIKQKVAASKGFQALVSYTDNGFEPASVTLTKGNTIRFVNNTSRALKLQIGETTTTIPSRDFFEYTFEKGETYSDGANSGTVKVE